MANWAAEIRIRAERRMGEMLTEQEMQKPGQYQQRSQGATLVPTLAEVGITYSMSSRVQKIANVPESEFEADLQRSKKPIETSGLFCLCGEGFSSIYQSFQHSGWIPLPQKCMEQRTSQYPGQK